MVINSVKKLYWLVGKIMYYHYYQCYHNGYFIMSRDNFLHEFVSLGEKSSYTLTKTLFPLGSMQFLDTESLT